MKQALQFLSEVRVEFSKVEWPNFNEFIGAFCVTLLFMAFFAIFLGSVDKVILWVVQHIFKSRL